MRRRHRLPSPDEEDNSDELELRAQLLLRQLSGVVTQMTDLLHVYDEDEDK